MDQKRNKLPLKLIFGIVAMFVVFAFSMAITSKTSAQQAATDTPTATATFTPAPGATESPAATASPSTGQNQTSPTSTPAAGATQSPSTGATQAPSTGATSTPGTTGSTGSIPVTGANQTSSSSRALAFSKAVTRLSNASDKNLENRYNELLGRLRKEQRLLNNATNKLNQFTNRFGNSNTANNNNSQNNANNNSQNNQNGSNANQGRNGHAEEIRENLTFFMRSYAIAQREVMFAQNALTGRGGFDQDGNLVNRQAAVNTLALAETSLLRSNASFQRISNLMDGSGDMGRFQRNEERLEQPR